MFYPLGICEKKKKTLTATQTFFTSVNLQLLSGVEFASVSCINEEGQPAPWGEGIMVDSSVS